jgi:opacity protein-like surface antigen
MLIKQSLSLLSLAVTICCTAQPSAYPFRTPSWLHPILTLSAGGISAKVGRTQTLNAENDFSNYQYQNRGGYSGQVIAGGFIGNELLLQHDVYLQTGLAFYQPASFLASGMLTQGIDEPSSDQYVYHYRVNSRQILVETKLLGTVHATFHPYLLVGIGAGFNKAYAYTADLPLYNTFTPQFTAAQQASFSYSLGAGLDVTMNKHLRIGVGYRFSNLGKANLGSGLLDTQNFAETITQSNLYASHLIAQLTYLVF